MKNSLHINSLLGLLLSFLFIQANAQNNDCVQCSGSVATGDNASAIGKNTTASGNNALAGGYNTTASGSNSFAFGYGSTATKSTTVAIGNNATASGIGSFAFGSHVKATAQNAFVFGAGTTENYPLTNSTPNSIAFGVNSNKPTLLITMATNNNFTGKVGLGKVTNPQTKLHIKADSNEDAGLFLEPENKKTRKAFIQLFDSDHQISVDNNLNMTLNAGAGNMGFQGISYNFGNPKESMIRLYTSEKPAIYFNAQRTPKGEIRDSETSSYAIDFNKEALSIRSAVYQSPRGSEITNWRNAVIIDTDGKIGIGTEKTVDNYTLAVNGGIISTKVYIKEVNQWPDHVFTESHELMDLHQLKTYLTDHKHLPGVPSEAEVTGHGYDLNEMQCILLEKIEEMTRYILLLQDEIDQLSANSQDKNILFTYDENGNRISRSVTFKRISKPGQENVVHNDPIYELFPNPTHGKFTLALKETAKQEQLHLLLLTSTGTVIEEHDIAGNSHEFDLSHKPNGIYLLEVQSKEGAETWKVIKN